MRLPYGVKDLFEAWLDEHFPDRKHKVLNRIRDLRGGKLTAPAFGERMRGAGVWADTIATMFHAPPANRPAFPSRHPELSTAAFRKVTRQPGLFES